MLSEVEATARALLAAPELRMVDLQAIAVRYQQRSQRLILSRNYVQIAGRLSQAACGEQVR
eukprot:4632505-Amphidinium_carterae.3